jgi:hypothetical protein
MSFLGIGGNRSLARQADVAMGKIQAMKLDPTLNQANQMAQGMANYGLDAASIQLARQEANRGINAGLSGLRRVRGGQGQVNRMAAGLNDFGLGLAAKNADTLRQNRQLAIQSGMQYGQIATELEKSKREAEFNKISAAQNRAAQERAGLMGALGAIGGGLLSKSDFRLKDNITLVGKSPEGINIYTFGYIGEDGLYQGVMAQELLGTKFNDSVVITEDGMYAVNYSNIDVEFKKINQ